MQVAMRRPALGRRTIIGVDPDQWTVFHGSHPFLEMDSAKPVVIALPFEVTAALLTD
jgi:hypothetical protein